MNVCVLLSLAVYFVFRRQFHYTWIYECDKYVRTYPFIKSATKVVFRIGYILNTRDHDHEKTTLHIHNHIYQAKLLLCTVNGYENAVPSSIEPMFLMHL